MKSLAERIAIMQAYLKGERIQTESTKGGTWMDFMLHDFDWFNHDYRIKPAEQTKLYHAICKTHNDMYYIPDHLYPDVSAARNQLGDSFIRLLTEREPIYVEVPE